MKGKRVSRLLLAVLASPILASAQTSQSTRPAVACPIEIRSFTTSAVTAHITNTSGKTIVGLVFNAALSDATEHWKWVHWDFDDSRPLRDFGWNKTIKPGERKRLVWDRGWGSDLDVDHIAGGALRPDECFVRRRFALGRHAGNRFLQAPLVQTSKSNVSADRTSSKTTSSGSLTLRR